MESLDIFEVLTESVEDDCFNATSKGVNMADLIRIEKLGFGNEEVNSVNLRDVWSFLEISTKFNDWVKDKLDGFQEGEDFIILSLLKKEQAQNMNNSCNKKEYAVTVDVAKEICMLQKNEKGRELRKYFIDCEKQLLAQPPQKTPMEIYETMNPEQMGLVLTIKIGADEKIKALTGEIKNLKENKLAKELTADAYLEDGGLKSISTFAKEIYPEFGIGVQAMFKLLRDKKYLNQDSTASAFTVNHGFFVVREIMCADSKYRPQTFLTRKGELWVVKGLRKTKSLLL